MAWADCENTEGRLRLDDAQEFTGSAAAEVARRLLAGEGRPGACTPAGLFVTPWPSGAAESSCCHTRDAAQ
ncbi:hypothetical protein [Streptomyces sp. NPDC102360]|uniref:hypothetical protein n=1 Tax=Streptomyces sp. NPDC102360 TaxID=3366160 RepID=UPI00381D6149